MADHEKIRRITISLAELFPEKKNQLEKINGTTIIVILTMMNGIEI